MTARERRQYEMLLRVRDFGTMHGELFSPSGVGQQALAAVNAAIDQLKANALMKVSAAASSRADRKAAARMALTELLSRVSQLARVFRARGYDLPSFALPRASKSDQTVLTVARQFARDAALFEAEFSGHGLGPAQIADATATFERAIGDRRMGRADHTAACTRLRDLITSAVLDVRRLDLILEGELGRNNVIQGAWKQARHVATDRRRSRRAVAAQDFAPVLPFEPRMAEAA